MTETSPAVEVQHGAEYGVPGEPRTSLLVALTLAWLAVILWGAYAAIAANGAAMAAISAAIAVPTVVAASVLAGGAVGLAAVSGLARRTVPAARRWAGRLIIGAGTGLVTGGIAGTSILVTWGADGSIIALAIALGAAGLLGAALAVAVPRPVAAAGLSATLAVFVTGFAIKFLFHDWLMDIFGAGQSAESQVVAFRWFGRTQAVLSALVGGLLAYWHLRRGGRSSQSPPRWPSYLLAGALPGLMLLLAEGVTRLGGARLLALVITSEPDSVGFSWAADSRINHLLVVLFLAPILAMLAVGRTLPQAGDAVAEPVGDEAVAAQDIGDVAAARNVEEVEATQDVEPADPPAEQPAKQSAEA